jgi:CHAT domain-containing protein
LLLGAADIERRYDQTLVAELARVEAEIQRLDGSPPVVVTGTVSFGEHAGADGRPSGGYVIAITKSWMDVIPLGPTAEIETRCAKLLDMLERFGGALSLPFFQSESAAPYDILLRPVWSRAEADLSSVRHLVVAPDGVLHKMPLDLLVAESGHVQSWRELDFVARRYSTEYVPSATVFADARRGRYRRGDPGRLFVGFGDPAYSPSWQPAPLASLPGTRWELDRISALVRASAEPPHADPVRPFLDVKARKDFLADPNLLREARYLHLAYHGSAGTVPYEEGALYLSQTDDSTPLQSVLTSREVMDLRTNASLVVLSCCESGLGALSRGEGIQGLTRAWLFAGAQAVIASQWRVDDEATTEVMTEFYRGLLTGTGSVTEAFVAAKQAAIESDRFSCPAFWGGIHPDRRSGGGNSKTARVDQQPGAAR